MMQPGSLPRVKAAIKIITERLGRPTSEFAHVVSRIHILMVAGLRFLLFLLAVGWGLSQFLEPTLRSLPCGHHHRQLSPSRSAGKFLMFQISSLG